MHYSPELLAKHLGRRYDPKAEYVIETHRGAASRVLEKTHRAVGKVPDFSTNELGTMIVMEVIPPPKPKESIIKVIAKVVTPKPKPKPEPVVAKPPVAITATPKLTPTKPALPKPIQKPRTVFRPGGTKR